MAKKLYVYLNDDDLSIILEMIYSAKLSIYDKDKAKVFKVEAISSNVTTYFIGYNSDCGIRFSPNFYTLNQLQCASFYLEDVDNKELLTIFNKIKNYIHKSYMLSNDKSCYIGPNIYLDWLNKKYCFPIIFECDIFAVKNIESIFVYAKKCGYTIKVNNVRLRDANNIDLSAESFVIFQSDNQLVPTVIRKTMIRYEYDSECIFVFYNKKTNYYEFVLDKRISLQSSNVTTLFNSIKDVFGENSGQLCD